MRQAPDLIVVWSGGALLPPRPERNHPLAGGEADRREQRLAVRNARQRDWRQAARTTSTTAARARRLARHRDIREYV